MRRGREYYGKKYEEALRLREEGKSVSEVAGILGISYSAAYHWLKGIRKPDIGKVSAFEKFLADNGPQPAEEMRDFFPKHNELFLIASRRGVPVKRMVLDNELKGYSTWYFIKGQEEQLAERVEAMLGKVKELKEKLRSALGV